MPKLRRSSFPVKSIFRPRAIWWLVVVPALLLLPVLIKSLRVTRLLDSPTSLLAQQTLPTMSHPSSGEGQLVNIPYFTESDGLSSTLTLNNNMPDPMTASVILYNIRGEPFALPPISLQPQLPARFSLRDLTTNAPGDFSAGNLQIGYEGISMAVTCQVSIVSEKKRLSFESVETSPMEFASSTLDGIVWVPDEDTQARVALTNIAPSLLTVTATGGPEVKKKSQTLTLKPRETQVLQLSEFLDRGAGTSPATLLSLQHNGLPGDLIATGFALNPKRGFSSSLHFVDGATAASSHLAGAHLRFGLANPKEGFPAGTTFVAPLVIANAGDSPTQVDLSVDYTIDSSPQRVELARIALAPKEVQQIELSQQLAAKGVAGPIDDAGIDISYNGARGSVIARLTSLDQSGDYSFDMPIKDPLSGLQQVNGNYPWRLDNGYNTVLHLKNTIDKGVYAIVQFRYAGGTYNPERIKLAPYQTIAIDIRRMRDSQKKDIRDGVMPKNVTSGQVIWYQEEVDSLIGRAEVSSSQAGVASSFSCFNPCNCNPWYYGSYMSPGSFVGLVGDPPGQAFRPMEKEQDCHGTIFGSYDMTSSVTSWSSTNGSIAPVSPTGAVSCLSPGSCDIKAIFNVIRVACGLTSSVTPVGGMTVRKPHHLKVVKDDIGDLTICPTTKRRYITYQVVDISNAAIGVGLKVKESFGSKSANTCNTTISTTETCTSISSDTFTDGHSVGCNSVGGSCGYTYTNQKWWWCPNGGLTPVTIATIGDAIVHNNSISVGGRTTAYSPGTYFYP